MQRSGKTGKMVGKDGDAEHERGLSGEDYVLLRNDGVLAPGFVGFQVFSWEVGLSFEGALRGTVKLERDNTKNSS